MPYWPFVMGASALLMAWGLRVGGWQVPAVIFATYVCVRAIVMVMPDGPHGVIQELAIGMAWITSALIMAYYFQAWVPAFFAMLTGAVYPVMLPLGYRLDYMGAMAITTEVFALLMLLSIGGGLYGLASADSSDGSVRHHNAGGALDRLAVYTLGVAAR